MDEIIFKDSKGKTKMKLTNDELVIEEKPKKEKKKEEVEENESSES